MTAGRVGAAAAAVPRLTCSADAKGSARNSGVSSVVDDLSWKKRNTFCQLMLGDRYQKVSNTGVVTTGRFSIVLKHVVLFEVPIVAKTTEDPLGPRPWLSSRSSVDKEVVDCDLTGADRAGGVNILKGIVSEVGKQISWRNPVGKESASIIFVVGKGYQCSTGLRFILSVPPSVVGLSKVR